VYAVVAESTEPDLHDALRRTVVGAIGCTGATAKNHRPSTPHTEDRTMADEPGEQRVPIARPNALPAQLRAGLESMSGSNSSDAQVHRESALPASVDALGHTQGQDIYLAPGQEHRLPHERWRVVQQMSGRISQTIQVNGAPVNDDEALEREADSMGHRAQDVSMHIVQRSAPEHEEELQFRNGPVSHSDLNCTQHLPA
jgi:hypothetical protein